jgi:hypothetical protein
MSVSKVGKFDLRVKDFHTGKLISPCKNTWNTCDCCGKKIVKGAVLSNGNMIGDDCENVRWRAQSSMRGAVAEVASMAKMFGLLPRVQKYMIDLYA